MKKLIRKIATIIIIVAMIVVSVNSSGVKAATKKKPKLNKKSVTLTMTNKKKSPAVTLKVKNAGSKKVSWKSSNKKVANIKVTGKYNAKITAKKAGKANITCKTNGKKLVCKITVKKTNATCDHKWVEKWFTYEHEGDYTSTVYACNCGVFASEDELIQHRFKEAGYRGSGSKMAQKVGIHGTKAKSSSSIIDGRVYHVTIKTKYMEYYCTKCGKKYEW
ncbi:MAG: hypothetical protein K2K70_11825 [Lachnospiraceae bacterium]|nr:hypothetical protein [Lachnospiraceae bacterium]